ncbi:MAG: hypothetical protein NDI61_04570 [Bdellovibrionaceae bacterium]|nr:hypothetical protein [Pseudobdellovibrionaceae bacterium]
MISLRTHNIADYVVGVVLIVCPFLFNFAHITAAANLFLISGIALVMYSLLTNYYYAVARIIPLGMHMALDTALGILMILAPALFGYRDLLSGGQYALHVVLGLGAVGLVALTRTRTETAKSPSERASIAREAPLTR